VKGPAVRCVHQQGRTERLSPRSPEGTMYYTWNYSWYYNYCTGYYSYYYTWNYWY
jgi:hypothetical protein